VPSATPGFFRHPRRRFPRRRARWQSTARSADAKPRRHTPPESASGKADQDVRCSACRRRLPSSLRPRWPRPRLGDRCRMPAGRRDDRGWLRDLRHAVLLEFIDQPRQRERVGSALEIQEVGLSPHCELRARLERARRSTSARVGTRTVPAILTLGIAPVSHQRYAVALLTPNCSATSRTLSRSFGVPFVSSTPQAWTSVRLRSARFLMARPHRRPVPLDPEHGGRPRRLAGRFHDATGPVWSPRGNWIAFGRNRLWLMRPDGSDAHRVTRQGFAGTCPFDSCTAASYGPEWSPDGRSLFYFGLTGR